jgi:hypothetical protein
MSLMGTLSLKCFLQKRSGNAMLPKLANPFVDATKEFVKFFEQNPTHQQD